MDADHHPVVAKRRSLHLAEWNPVSAVTQAARELFGNIPSGVPEPTAWPLQNAALYTLMWVMLTISVFAPLAVRRYKNAGARN
jgi:hypothetical protein